MITKLGIINVSKYRYTKYLGLSRGHGSKYWFCFNIGPVAFCWTQP